MMVIHPLIKLILSGLLFGFLSLPHSSLAQGISFSYLIPTTGDISAPVSPFSLRGVGIGTGAFGIETGGTLYSISGLTMENLPFKSEKPFVGQHFGILVPVEAYVAFKAGSLTTKLLGGGFATWHINPRLNFGHIDRAIREYEDWEVANANLDLKTTIGFGWMSGISFSYQMKKGYSIIAEVQYLSGAAGSELSGTYTGGNSGEPLNTVQIDDTDAEIALRGFEVSLGVQLK